MRTIAVIGLGNMGGPMAVNLKQAGCTVKGYDLSQSAKQTAQDNNITICDTPTETVNDADVIITMLPNGIITLSVYEEILPNLGPDAILIDCSTIDIKSAKTAHDLAKQQGLQSLDAPVSGGVTGAEAGTLTFMVGGEKETLDLTQKVFDAMGSRTVHCGGPGAGQAAKICNNMLLAISMIGSCEVFSLAEKLGLNQQALFDVISTSSGQCWSVNTYCPVPGVGPQSPADNEYKPGFAAELMLKDLLLGKQAAQEYEALTPLGEHATQLYKILVENGAANMDFSAIIKILSATKEASEAD